MEKKIQVIFKGQRKTLNVDESAVIICDIGLRKDEKKKKTVISETTGYQKEDRRSYQH